MYKAERKLANVVIATRCDSYEQTELSEAIVRVVKPLGNIAAILGETSQVFCKPNLMGPFCPSKCITTHPAFLRAVMEYLTELGYRCLVGDSPAAIYSDSKSDEILLRTGVLEAIQRIQGAEWVSVESLAAELITLNGGLEIPLAATPKGTPTINLPKLKSHVLVGLSCAVKNLLGMVPGRAKLQLHRHCPSSREMAEVCRDICQRAGPSLTIVDGVVGLDGLGPGETGSPKASGVILASVSPFALDIAVTRLLGGSSRELPMTRACHDALGAEEPEIVWAGGRPDSLAVAWEFPNMHCADMKAACASIGAGSVAVRIRIDRKRCRQCGGCVEVCPVGAMTWSGDLLALDEDRCVGCFCCVEMCPCGAVLLERPA